MTILKTTLLFTTLTLVLAGCSAATDETANAHAPDEAQGDAAGHDEHGHGAGVRVTHYTPDSELFVEYPPLVAGQASEFVAHLTWLKDFTPASAGRLIVTLSGDNRPDERVEVNVSDTAGIFRPVLTPRHQGIRRLTLSLVTPSRTIVHDLGEVDVFADQTSADLALSHDAEQPGLISFTKEQQWKMPFATAQAVSAPVRDSVAVSATLRPRAAGEAMLTAPGAGILRATADGFPELGMAVKAGQVLAYLSPRLGGDTDAASLELDVQRARIRSEQAEADLERLQALLADEAIAARRVREASLAARLAKAELQAATQRMRGLAGVSGGIALRSPVSGRIVAVNGAAGAAVNEGQTIIHVASLDTLWLEARIAESDLGRIAAPTGASFELDGRPTPVTLDVGRNARLVAYGGMVDATTRTVPAIFEFANGDGSLRAGMRVRARVYSGSGRPGIVIPAAAVLDENGQPVVYVLRQGESFERRPVRVGARDGDRIAITSGLAAGERVVTTGAYQIRLAAASPAAMGHGHAH